MDPDAKGRSRHCESISRGGGRLYLRDGPAPPREILSQCLAAPKHSQQAQPNPIKGESKREKEKEKQSKNLPHRQALSYL